MCRSDLKLIDPILRTAIYGNAVGSVLSVESVVLNNSLSYLSNTRILSSLVLGKADTEFSCTAVRATSVTYWLFFNCTGSGKLRSVLASSPPQVQIRPWNLSDSDFVMDGSQPLDPRKTIFVGGVPRPLRAGKWTGTSRSCTVLASTGAIFFFLFVNLHKMSLSNIYKLTTRFRASG